MVGENSEARLTAIRQAKADWGLVAVALVAALVIMTLYRGASLGSDVAGQFWIARAMRHGMRLYVDFIEVNPPLWFWMALPVDALAEAAGVRPEPVVIAVLCLIVLAAVIGTGRLMRGHGMKARLAFQLYAMAILLMMPFAHLEQREHLALIGAVPYAMIAAARRQRKGVDTGTALSVGIGAALGFALKPPFLAVPLFLEAWLLFTAPRAWRPFRAETIGLAATGAFYFIAVLTVTPAYLSQTIPFLLAAYQPGSPPFLESFGILPAIWLCMLLGVLPFRKAMSRGEATVTSALLLAALGFATAYVIQHKGWLYQGLPTTGCLALALAAGLIEVGRPRSIARLFMPALLVWPLAFPLVSNRPSGQPLPDIAPALAGLRPGDAFGLVSTIGWTEWPSTLNRGLRSSSRYGAFWILATVDRHPEDARLRAIAHDIVRQTAVDYRCLPPKVIVFTRFDRDGADARASADPYRFFMQEPSFAAVLTHYRLDRRFAIFDVYRRISSPDPIDPQSCRRPG